MIGADWLQTRDAEARDLAAMRMEAGQNRELALDGDRMGDQATGRRRRICGWK